MCQDILECYNFESDHYCDFQNSWLRCSTAIWCHNNKNGKTQVRLGTHQTRNLALMGELKGLYCECFGDNRPYCLEAEIIFSCHVVCGDRGLPRFHGGVRVQTSVTCSDLGDVFRPRWRVQTLVTYSDHGDVFRPWWRVQTLVTCSDLGDVGRSWWRGTTSSTLFTQGHAIQQLSAGTFHDYDGPIYSSAKLLLSFQWGQILAWKSSRVNHRQPPIVVIYTARQKIRW